MQDIIVVHNTMHDYKHDVQKMVTANYTHLLPPPPIQHKSKSDVCPYHEYIIRITSKIYINLNNLRLHLSANFKLISLYFRKVSITIKPWCKFIVGFKN